MYFYTVHEVLPGLLIFGAGFVLLGLAAAAVTVLWNAAKHLVQRVRQLRLSHIEHQITHSREEMPGADLRPRLALAGVAAWRAHGSFGRERADKWS